MSNYQIAKTAKDVIENKLGFKMSITDVVLLESGDDGKTATYILFRRYGFNDIEYAARWNNIEHTYELEISNTKTDTEIYI